MVKLEGFNTNNEFQSIDSVNYSGLFQANKLPKLQNQTNEILINETARMEAKKANMDAELHNSDRMILLNQSYLERQKMYSVIILLFVFFFGFAVFLGIFKERLGYAKAIVTSVQVISIAVGCVSILFVGKDMVQRDSIEFSKLDQTMLMKTYNKSSLDLSNNDTKYTSNLTKTIANTVDKTCVGADCCVGPGFQWDSQNNKCRK